ncbi:MAG: Smr/MutS family protein [Pseudomonadota bacterium]
MSKRRLKPEEQRAWARVARSVKALPGTPAPDPGPAPLDQDAVERALSAPSTAQPRPTIQAAYPPRLTAPADRSRERRIKRGQTAIAARFDLHGHTQDSAHRALPVFLSSQRSAGARCVLVITGKGRAGEGVLRRNFLRWLQTHDARALVSGYAEAHAKHGGGGAFYVFLRRL